MAHSSSESCQHVGFHGTSFWDCFSIIAARGLQSDYRARLSLRATQGRKCFLWQMHVKLPPEHITATISVTPSLISELIGLLSNGREGQRYAQALWERNAVNVHGIWAKDIPFNLGIYNGEGNPNTFLLFRCSETQYHIVW